METHANASEKVVELRILNVPIQSANRMMSGAQSLPQEAPVRQTGHKHVTSPRQKRILQKRENKGTLTETIEKTYLIKITVNNRYHA